MAWECPVCSITDNHDDYAVCLCGYDNTDVVTAIPVDEEHIYASKPRAYIRILLLPIFLTFCVVVFIHSYKMVDFTGAATAVVMLFFITLSLHSLKRNIVLIKLKEPVITLNRSGIVFNKVLYDYEFIPWSCVNEIVMIKRWISVYVRVKYVVIKTDDNIKYINTGSLLKRFIYRINTKLDKSPIAIEASYLKLSDEQLLSRLISHHENSVLTSLNPNKSPS